MKKTKTKKWLTALLMAGALWMNGQTTCTISPCTGTVPACELVCNPSFEISNGYPTKIADFSFDQVSIACGWENANLNTTPDYYHAWTSFTTVGVPCNLNGKENERTGKKAYAGFLASTDNGNWYERIATKLTHSLVPGNTYEVSFWLSLSDKSIYNELNNVGFTFHPLSQQPYSNPIFYVNTGNVVANSWTKFTYTYTPPITMVFSNYLIIGSFGDISGNPVSYSLCSSGSSTNTCPGYNYTNQNAAEVYYFIDDVSVKEILPLNVTATSTTGCLGESFTLTASGASTYTWQPNNLTGANIVVTPTSTTIYTVTGTTSSGCSTTTETIGIYPASCCTNPNSGAIHLKNVTLMAYNTPTTTARPWSSLTTGNYYTGNIAVPSNSIITNTLSVIGGLDIKTPVTFSNCNVSINMDCAIRQYSTTTIRHSYLWGCDNLWTGIMSYDQLTIVDSWIEDAFSAVNGGYFLAISNHPGIIVDNVMFNKNYYGILTGMCTMNPGNFKVTGSIFSSRNFGTADYLTTTRYTSLFPNIAAKSPAKIKGSVANSITANTIRSNVGIYFVALTSNTTNPTYFTIGDVSATSSVNATFTNKFDYINEGIINGGSKVNIYNNSFSNIINTGLGNTLGAIYHSDNHGHTTGTKVGALGGAIPTANYKNTFNTVLDGVTAVDGGALDVQYNDFATISRYGVNVKTWKTNAPSTETVVVSNNSFSTTAYAFYAYDNQTITATVATNTLVQSAVTYTNYYNVYINEIAKPSTASYSITANNFSGSLYGVYAINSKNVRVVNNTIQIAKPTSTSIYNAPVWLDNSDNCFIKGNTLSCNPTNASSWNTYGIFSNASVNNVYKCNTISKVSACLKFQSACNPSSIYYNSLNNNPSDPCLYGLWLDASGQTGNIGYWNGVQWQMSDDIWGDFSGSDTYAQNSSVGSTIYYDGSNTLPKPLSLYQPQLNGRDNLLSTLYSPVSTSNINSQTCTEAARMMNPNSGGKSSSVRGNPAESFSHAGFDNANDESIYGASNKKRLFLPVVPSTSTSKVIKGANEANFYLVDSLIDLYYQTQNLSILNSAKNVNASIVANNNQEQNQKDFNSIYCVYVQADSLVSTTQILNLQGMAWLCPFTEGLAVYEARALMRKWDDTTVYFNACENNPPQFSATSRLANNAQAVSETMIGVYPNPTNGILTVTSNCKDCIFVVYDIAGRIVLSQKLNENETKVDVSSLNNGTYIYKISNNGTSVKVDKLILNK